ncbi:methylenetetrahydrofolate reductase C-terminal domain-containing protein [Mycobacterium sp. IDR2000157661]|uniref:methylenetetrahydrofolate reductase C-terminal domain-containing protein n=1 Tax=Mycobacterium sp. IDR2000157661 TaxID=2867005 RepID=UPI001EEB4AA1|nr:methylenetetrahydrofolate reductase C-terminal domain-containing protein [Mycobacterium sp. IDR2000157661]
MPVGQAETSGTLACPKKMLFGPCGGVRPDGQCEMRDGPCAFPSVVAWTGLEPRPTPVPAPTVLTDFSCMPFDEADVAATAGVLAPSCDAVLVGEHQNKPDFPPTMMARLLLDAGVTPWITLSCRDRNRVVLEQELRGLRSLGATTVFCVTGDGRGYDVRSDVTQTFDLDGPRLVALAASLGMTAAVPETPTAPPVPARPGRLVEKQRAGASLAVLNHVPYPHLVADFMATARSAGLAIPVIAAVAVFTDEVSAAVLQGLPGLDLDQEVVEQVLGAADPVAAGIAAAITEARALLSVEGVEGVNVSGLASASGARAGAEIKAEVGRLIKEGAQ